MRAEGKTIAVTGGANGIGRELVFNLLDRGARVAAIDLSETALQETAKLARDRADRLSTHVVDVSKREQVGPLPAAVMGSHGQVDGLINCAGIIQPFLKLNDLDYAAIERVMNVNFWGVLHMTKAFLPHLLKRPEAHIVNVASMGAYLPVPGQTVYGASKAAVKLLTEGLHSELTQTPVSVTLVFPGPAATDIARHSGLDAPTAAESVQRPQKIKMTMPDEAARIIVEGMEKDAYRVVIGGNAKMMDWLSRLAPERAAALIYKQMRGLLKD